jgi:hypothetical protein
VASRVSALAQAGAKSGAVAARSYRIRPLGRGEVVALRPAWVASTHRRAYCDRYSRRGPEASPLGLERYQPRAEGRRIGRRCVGARRAK